MRKCNGEKKKKTEEMQTKTNKKKKPLQNYRLLLTFTLDFADIQLD